MGILQKRKLYKEFRSKYRPFLINAKREMDTTLQKRLIDAVAALAFSSGFEAGRKPPEEVEPAKPRKPK